MGKCLLICQKVPSTARVAAGTFGFLTLIQLRGDPETPNPAAAHRKRRSQTTASFEPVPARSAGRLACHVVTSPALHPIALLGVPYVDAVGTMVEGFGF